MAPATKAARTSMPLPDTAIAALGQRLSVFLSNYNHGHYLARALDGLLGQTVPPAEICVIDDGSSDNSAHIIADYARRFPIIRPIYREQNIGIYANLNSWLDTVDNEFVYLAAADDFVMPNMFERSLALLSRSPQAALCSSLIVLIDKTGRDLGVFPSPCPCRSPCFIAPARARHLLMKDDSWMIGNSTIYRLDALRRAGGFDPKLGGLTDGYVSRLLAVTHGACFVPEPLAAWRRDGSGIAARTLENPRVAAAVGEYAAGLIEASPAGVFPAGYARRWRGRWRYTMAARGLARSPKSGLAQLAELMTPLRWPDRFVLAVLKRLPAGGAKLGIVYAFLRFRAHDIWPVLMRRLAHKAGRHTA